MTREKVQIEYSLKDRVSKPMKRMRLAVVALGAVFVGSLLVGMRKTFDLFRTQRAVLRQTESVIQSTGMAAGLTALEVNKMAQEMQKVSNFGDEAIQTGQNMLLTFTKIGKDIFPQATEAMLNMSVAMNQGVKESAIQLGKALNDPIMGLTALRRVGIQFNKEQEALIRTLTESGEAMKAQKIILNELERQFGGSARAQADAVTQLKNALGDLGESIGELLAPAIEKAAKLTQGLVEKLQTLLDIQKVSTVEKIEAVKTKIKELEDQLAQIDQKGKDLPGVVGWIARQTQDFDAHKEELLIKVQEMNTELAELEEQALSERIALQASNQQKEIESVESKYQRYRELEQALTKAQSFEEHQRLQTQKKVLDEEIKTYIAFQKQKQKNFGDTLKFLEGGMTTSSKELFAIGKATAMANATISSHEAFNKALASAPPPFNYALAAATFAVGAARISQIASQKLELAEGGIVRATPGGTQAIIGEGGRDEAVIPLDDEDAKERLGLGLDGKEVTIVLSDGRELAKGIYQLQSELIRDGEIDAR